MAPPMVFEIIITNGDRAFNPGCFVTGKVVVQTSRRKGLVAIRLLLHGNSYVNPVGHHASETDSGKMILGRHLDCSVNLWGGNRGQERFLEAGSYQFPFAVKLPPISLPSSFESTAGAVRYWLEARMEKSSRSYFARKAFIIKERMDLNVGRENLFLSRRGESQKTFSGLGRRSGPLILTVSTDRSGYCPGEKILVTSHLDNSSGKEMKKVKATLYCRVSYMRQRQDPRPHVIDTLVSQLRMCQPIGAGRHVIWDRHPLPIPVGILPSSHTSAIIHTDYMLVIKVSTPALLEDVWVTLPIVIGTEPLRPFWDHNPNVCPPYEALATGGLDRLGSTARPVSWAGPPSYSSLSMPTVGSLVRPLEAPPRYTPHPTPVVGSATHYPPRQVSAEHRGITEPQVSASSVTPPQVSASLSVTLPEALTSPSVTPPQVSASPSVTTPQVSTSPSITPPQVSASPSVTPPPQVSASPSVTPPPQASTSPSVSPTQVSALSNTPPQVSAALSVTLPEVLTSPSGTPPPEMSNSPSISTTQVSASPSVTPTQVSASPSVTPPQVSASPNVTPTQVSASPSVTPTQVSASPSVTPTQVSASPSVTPPQVYVSAESPNTNSHPVPPPEVPSPDEVSSASQSVTPPPQLLSTIPRISPERPRRSTAFSVFSIRRRRSHTRSGYNVFVNATS